MEPMSDFQQPVELYLSCRKLKDLDFFGKSDPRVKIFLQTQGQWAAIGETEKVMDNLNPDFKKTIMVDYIFETKQPLRFDVFDVDTHTADDLIGTAETTLGEIMGARKQTLILDLHNKGKKSTGQIIIRGDKTGTSQNLIYWQWSGVKLANTDGWFGKSDPFLRFFKERAGGDWLQVHQTEFIKNNLDPVWKSFKITDDKLCGSNHTKTIRIECWDDQTDGKHRFIGIVDITIDKLKNGEKQFNLINPKTNKPAGTLKLISFTLEERPSFVDFIRGGEQLNAIVAIDFTGSNGDPRQPNSLHAMSTNGDLNEYQQVINSVCQIVLNYDYDKMMPVFGFGGKPRFPTFNSPQVSHCFPCSGNIQQSQVLGIQGLLDVYQYALGNVELSGPTYFAPILNEAVKVCEINRQNEADIYTIKLIITDGEIHDLDETIDVIVNAAQLPISVVIVGVGSADFTKMDILDGDKGLVNSKGKKCERDFVQFVPFRKFRNDMFLLAKHVLAEIPNQLVEYKKLVGKKPKAPLY